MPSAGCRGPGAGCRVPRAGGRRPGAKGRGLEAGVPGPIYVHRESEREKEREIDKWQKLVFNSEISFFIFVLPNRKNWFSIAKSRFSYLCYQTEKTGFQQ